MRVGAGGTGLPGRGGMWQDGCGETKKEQSPRYPSPSPSCLLSPVSISQAQLAKPADQGVGEAVHGSASQGTQEVGEQMAGRYGGSGQMESNCMSTG